MVVDLDEEEQKAIIDFINNHDFEEEDLDEDGYPQIIKIPVRKLLPFASWKMFNENNELKIEMDFDNSNTYLKGGGSKKYKDSAHKKIKFN